MLLCSSSSSSSSWEILASRRRFSSAKADLYTETSITDTVSSAFISQPKDSDLHPLSRGVTGQLIRQLVAFGLCLLPGPLSCSQVLETLLEMNL